MLVSGGGSAAKWSQTSEGRKRLQHQQADPITQLLNQLPVDVHQLIKEFRTVAPKTLSKPRTLQKILLEPDAAVNAIALLRRAIQPSDLTSKTPQSKNPTGETPQRRAWEIIGAIFYNLRRYFEAISILEALYHRTLEYQKNPGQRAHKGVPLWWIADCHWQIGHPWSALRYMMLSLCEDAITYKGKVDLSATGSYSRLTAYFGLPTKRFHAIVKGVFEISKKEPSLARFPEWLLERLPQDWMVRQPSPAELDIVRTNTFLVAELLKGIGKSRGRALETLACNLLAAIPGFRSTLGKKTKSTQLDVVTAVEASYCDFRAEIGRYFGCECKDWKKKPDFSVLAKFARVLDGSKCRFGILFSRERMTGDKTTTDATREVVKLFQQRDIAIVVVTHDDLLQVSKGRSFLTLLREKYEKRRFDS